MGRLFSLVRRLGGLFIIMRLRPVLQPLTASDVSCIMMKDCAHTAPNLIDLSPDGNTVAAEDVMRCNLNTFWQRVLGRNDIDFASRLTMTDLLELKHIICSINGLVTVKLTLAFIAFLAQNGIIDKATAKKELRNARLKSPYSNGFDVHIPGPTPIIAEVKCNIPASGNRFGAAQRTGILKDLRNLWHPEKKTKEKISIASATMRFMVMMEYGDKVLFDKAINQIIDDAAREDIPVIRWNDRKSVPNSSIIFLLTLTL